MAITEKLFVRTRVSAFYPPQYPKPVMRRRFLLRCAPLTHPNTCYTLSVILGLGVSPMRRREFIVLVGSSVAAWPLAARAQQPGKMPRVGYIRAGAPRNDPFREELVRGMRDLGYVEGRNIASVTVGVETANAQSYRRYGPARTYTSLAYAPQSRGWVRSGGVLHTAPLGDALSPEATGGGSLGYNRFRGW